MTNALRLLHKSKLTIGLLAYLFSSVPVLVGILFGLEFVVLYNAPRTEGRSDFIKACSRWDGEHYKTIAEKGYSYNPNKRSNVAFFPAYPLLGRLVFSLTGWPAALALIVTSNVMLVAALAATAAYLQARRPGEKPNDRDIILALLGFFPASFFFRMAYSESTFLFALTIFLLGTTRRWPLWILAFLAGMVTGIRPVGIACTATLVWFILFDSNRGVVRRLLCALCYLPLACWGLLGYMAYQQATFGNPLAFAQTQEHWTHGTNGTLRFWDKVDSLVSAEPIWSVYDPESESYWRSIDGGMSWLFSPSFWNPIMFVCALALVTLGWSRLWLTGTETFLGFGLLGIGYATRGYEMSMASQGRFAAIALPAYLVAGRIATWLPQWMIWGLFGGLTALLLAWSALFAAGYRLI